MLPVIDAHSDLFSKCIEEGLDWLDQRERFQASPEALARGDVRLQWASIYVPAGTSGNDATHYALRIVGAAHHAARRAAGAARIVGSRAAWQAIDWAGPRAGSAFLFSMEGASPLCGSVERLRVFAALGMRVLGLTHNHDNECGDGCFAKAPSGLTAAGRVIAAEAQALGVVLDAAHLNPVSFDQVIGLAAGPVIYSHGGSRELLDVPRNLTDRQARAIAGTGGVLGVDFYPGHVAADGRKGSIDDVVAHVEHWAALVGAAHVGFGGDFDGIPSTLEGVESAAVYPDILERLASRGFGPDDLERIAWRNWARIVDGSLSPGLGKAGAAGNVPASRDTAP